MSNLKDTDIDELFRRASDKYPLRTDSADWDRMAAALEKEPPMPPNGTVDAEEDRKKRRFFWLFLLLPLAGAGYFALHHTGNAGNTGATAGVVKTEARAEKAASHDATGVGAATSGAANPGATGAGAATSATANSGATGNSSVTVGDAAKHDPLRHTQEDTKPDKSLSPAAANHHRRQPGGEDGSAAGRHGSNGSIANHPGEKRFGENGSATIGHEANGSPASKRAANGSRAGSSATKGLDGSSANGSSANGVVANGLSADGAAAANDRLFYDLQRAAIPRDYRLAVNVTAPAAKKDSAKPKADKTKHFYAGVFGSPDLSTVKMQSVKGVGTTFGLILGYTFKGGRWAVETGAYVDRKKYYTEGEYFSTKEISLPPNSWLTDVDGVCYMWEIPVNVRYNFNPGAKTSWFATAGFSTYLMSREKYSYGLEWSGNPTVYDKNLDFRKSSQYPFSIINLSAGFEQRLGKIGNLRVEPYVRLPLTGLGTGKLPIMSAGVNIGITRQLW